MSYCAAPACGKQTHGHSRYCAGHAFRNRRHGHPLQPTISRTRLKPFIELIHGYIARHGGDDLWRRLEASWATAVREAQGIVAEAHSGRPFHRSRAEAAAQLLRVADTVPPREIIATGAAMYMLWLREPGAFASDEGAWVETARRYRSLSPANAKRYWNRHEGKQKRVLMELRRDVSIMLGRMLHEALGGIGRYILEGAEAEHQERATIRAQAYAALRHPESAVA